MPDLTRFSNKLIQYICAKGITVLFNCHVFVRVKTCAFLVIIYSCNIRKIHQNIHVKQHVYIQREHTKTRTQTTVSFFILLLKLSTQTVVITLALQCLCQSLWPIYNLGLYMSVRLPVTLTTVHSFALFVAYVNNGSTVPYHSTITISFLLENIMAPI